MKKILVISSYPAPYRVAVFRGLAKYYQMDVFFEFIQDQSRAAEWFVRSADFKVLNTPENKAAFDHCLKHVTEYDLVLAYDYNNTNAGRLIRTCIRKGVPYIINCDGAFIHSHWLKDMVKRYYISHAWGCFASGTHAADYFLHYGAVKEKIHY
ncbi:MAG: glycosyltransferase family 1 protein, partial [Lachnospiraceae bacterium]|nr:glycosyltransferase family 1 protein [Lachnospiraceae bacterium]